MYRVPIISSKPGTLLLEDVDTIKRYQNYKLSFNNRHTRMK